MSKHETWRTRQYWKEVGGLLIEEFYAVRRSDKNNTAGRHIDGVIVLGEKEQIAKSPVYDLQGKDIIVIQTKASRLGMYLMGQAFFSRELMKRFKPNSIRVVAICKQSDVEMEKLCAEHNIEVVVIPDK
ncbi:hypothetical protein [Endozoicomonas sp. ALC020]|uniref:hypothetical protein n=1 Tax=Endozoicomonas sp. ALC020 TaxID=3403077 RepID=UPI003BB0A3E2